MRVSTTLIFQQGLQNILQKQADLLKIQDQVSTGKRILTPSDDPSGASRILDLNEALAQIKQFSENSSYATQKLNLEEATLDSSTLVLQRVRELAIQAGNTGSSDLRTETIIASEMRERLEELFDYANTKDENGDYIFSGFQSKAQTFTTDGAGNYFYNGDEGQQQIQIGSNRQVTASDSGAQVFQLVRNGNGVFSVDTNSTNGGSAQISTGAVITPALYQPEDFTIVFDEVTPVTVPPVLTYSVFNNTTGSTTPVVGPTTYNDGNVIAFNGMEVEISGLPVDRDVFTVNASRNQDVFTTLNNLVDSLEKPGTGNIRGQLGGDFINNGFDSAAGDTIDFDITFDGINLSPVTVTVTVGDSNADIAQTLLDAIGTAAVVTANTDGSYTIPGSTVGRDVTFRLVGENVEFLTTGGTSSNPNRVVFDNIVDAGGDGDAVLGIFRSGNSITTQATLDAAVVGDTATFLAGVPLRTQINQQIDNALNNIDRVMDSIINTQTRIGGRINSIESQAEQDAAKSESLQAVRSEIENIDLAEAISNLTFQTTALQISQQTFVRVQGLSLFEFI